MLYYIQKEGTQTNKMEGIQMRDDYKVKQLQEMLKYEKAQPESEKYGAHLTHWSGNGNPINLDEGALKILIKYYSK